jgi:hypothetical protein
MRDGQRVPFAQAFPATVGYAAGQTWFIQDQPIRVRNREYVKFGVPRVIQPGELTSFETYQGVPVFVGTGAPTPPDVIYVPVRPGCEFQPYQPRVAIRPRG